MTTDTYLYLVYSLTYDTYLSYLNREFFPVFQAWNFTTLRLAATAVTRFVAPPVVGLLKLGDVGLQEATVAEMAVQLAVFVDEFLHEIHRSHRLAVLRKKTRESP